MEITLSTLQKLAANKAPIVGIPRLDGKPFAVQRTTLAGLIVGLETCEISMSTHLEIQGQRRYYKLVSLNMQRWDASYKMLRAWATRQRVKKAAPKFSREEQRKSELLRKIANSERKARRIWVSRPHNPVLELGDIAGDYERQEWAAWVAQKSLRRKIGKLATAHGLIHGYIPDAVIRESRKLYERLSALTGHYVTKYGELRTMSRSEKPIEAQYLKHLYEYAGAAFQSKPYRHQEWRTPEHIRQDRQNYCQRMRDWRNAQETVDWLRAQLLNFDASQESGNEVR